jgi:hypothetical protein
MPATERIAVLSDVHGNLTAFEAVLRDVDDAGSRRFWVTSRARVRAGRRRIRLVHASADGVYTRVHVDHTRGQLTGMFATTELTGPGPEPTTVGYGDVHDTYVEVVEGRTLFNCGARWCRPVPGHRRRARAGSISPVARRQPLTAPAVRPRTKYR